ncbi:MupG family TIM beta-alpha barrel fold protein [Salipaludibacillus sp. LMS25]|uniref:DUF871 domain-containing protein n=1 Tax=Salipaludibacillus sp. LMS25 TaxID=2924031 RepID=UPI0020D173FC|nr:MupG family TIM beta-alpha barrel fold protein [Salipaludibacillus sp. LMS25]UTR13536.1 MupG family TIM beta-alpha barrel fold protein [Salipaludibacillus sp. LMS25]
MKGVSIFLGQQTEQKQKSYLERMKQAGFQSIFTSLHIPEDDPQMYIRAINVLGQQAKDLGMSLIADISPTSLSYLNVDIDTLIEKGMTGLRVDYGFDNEAIIEISKKMTVFLNASTLSYKTVYDLLNQGLIKDHCDVCHNYYPRPETGLDKDWFIETNKWLRSFDFKTMAFVPGDLTFRGPLYKGLPTLEKHRHVPPFVAAKELWDQCAIDHVYIGDPAISKETSELFRQYDEDGVIVLRARFFHMDDTEYAVLNQLHRQRLDPARDVVRSETSRAYAQKEKSIITARSTRGKPSPVEKTRQVGSITIDNERYGRYQGELQIVKRKLAYDPAVNIVGKVIDEDLPLVQHLKPGETFMFKHVEPNKGT